MSADFFTAAIPEPVTILGVRLRAFSLGHVLLLNRFGNAYGIGTAPALPDLIQAVVICSQDYQSALADMDNPALPKWVSDWQRSIQPRNKFGIRKSELGFSVPAKLLEFAEYIRAGSTFPIFSVEDNKAGTKIDVPLVQSVKVCLQSKMGLSEDEVLNRPWGLCLWDYFTIHAIDGHCRITEIEDYSDLQKQADEFERRMAAI